MARQNETQLYYKPAECNFAARSVPDAAETFSTLLDFPDVYAQTWYIAWTVAGGFAGIVLRINYHDLTNPAFSVIASQAVALGAGANYVLNAGILAPATTGAPLVIASKMSFSFFHSALVPGTPAIVTARCWAQKFVKLTI